MPRRTALVFLLALVAGTLTATIALRDNSRFSSDSFQYMLLGDALAHGRGFVSGGSQHPDITRSPLLPLLIAPLVWVLGDAVRAGIAVVTLSAAALAVPLFYLCRELFGTRAAYAALPLASLSCVLGSADRVLPTPLHVLGVVSTAALLLHGLRHGRPRSYLLAGMAGGLTALARPEGLPFLVLPLGWALAGPLPFPDGAAAARPPRARLTAAAFFVLGAALVFGPFVMWASAHLHRFAPVPSLQYVEDTRYITDRFGLREIAEPRIPWEERALFLLTADHRERVLDFYFRTREMPPVDAPATRPERATAGPESPARTEDLVRRTLQIAVHNLRLVPSQLRGAHLLPPVPILLGLAGLLSLCLRRGGWRPLAFTTALLGITALPVLTNTEDRFLYAPFAVGLAVAAGGWGEVDRLAAARLPALARIAFHGLLAWNVAVWGLTHRMPETPKLNLEQAQRALAARVARVLPPGPMLAVRPHFPFWVERPYAPLPILGPEAVLAFAQLHGAPTLVLQIPYDVKNRPDLAALTAATPPPGFIRLDAEPIEGGGELQVFRLGLSGGEAAGRAP
jgi:hypothetical protein